MTQRFNLPFTPVYGTTAPTFQSSALGTTSHFYALESTALNRVWQGPSNRTVRLAELSGGDYHVKFGTTLAVAASSDSMLVLGGVVETFGVPPDVTHVAFVSSTTVTVNVTPGYGS